MSDLQHQRLADTWRAAAALARIGRCCLRYRVVALCLTENGELNAAMVRRKWAVDYTNYSGGSTDETQVRREQLGHTEIWVFLGAATHSLFKAKIFRKLSSSLPTGTPNAAIVTIRRRAT